MKCILSIRYIQMLSSPSMRREWIEISLDPPSIPHIGGLPPCGGSGLKFRFASSSSVFSCLPPCGGSGLKFLTLTGSHIAALSPSMRREWIEMVTSCTGLGLKCILSIRYIQMLSSPSMRREWIEISLDPPSIPHIGGLPPCGGSGLKFRFASSSSVFSCLPPCGGSGLKFLTLTGSHIAALSPSMRREWIEMVTSCTGLGLTQVSLHAEGVD